MDDIAQLVHLPGLMDGLDKPVNHAIRLLSLKLVITTMSRSSSETTPILKVFNVHMGSVMTIEMYQLCLTGSLDVVLRGMDACFDLIRPSRQARLTPCLPSLCQVMAVVRSRLLLTFLEEGEIDHGRQEVVGSVQFGSIVCSGREYFINGSIGDIMDDIVVCMISNDYTLWDAVVVDRGEGCVILVS